MKVNLNNTDNNDYVRGYKDGKIAGATAEAVRAQNILINALEDAKGKLEYYGDSNGIADIDEAIQQWKEGKEVGNGIH